MSYREPTYVIFDADEDRWAYSYMRGWKSNEKVDFDFFDAHDLTAMTGRAESEEYVKRQLRERMNKANAVIVLVGEKTRNLFRFVRWEIELAIRMDKPIIVVNLNNARMIDTDRCPPILRNECAIHVPFKLKAIKCALDGFPEAFRRFAPETKSEGPRFYNDSVYRDLGI